MLQIKTSKKARKKYAQELSDRQWRKLAPLLPQAKKKAAGPGRPPLQLREVLNRILYVLRTGCQWDMLPHHYRHYKRVYHYYNTWSK
jgi:putative transposase